MNKQIVTLIIVALVALLVGFIAGGVKANGCCPITGKVICKERAEACKNSCHTEKACHVAEEKEAASSEVKPEAASK